jgi:hypothetical protein
MNITRKMNKNIIISIAMHIKSKPVHPNSAIKKWLLLPQLGIMLSKKCSKRMGKERKIKIVRSESSKPGLRTLIPLIRF